MTLLLVFVGCLFTIFTLWLTIAPFVGADRGLHLEHLDEEVREIELLVARRQVLLVALRELDFDRETDKIGAADYERFRGRYEGEAVQIMRRLDEIHGGSGWQQRVDEELTERLGHAPQIRGVDDETESHAVEADVDEPDEDVDEPALEGEDSAVDEAEAEESGAEEPEADAPTVLGIDDVSPMRCANCDTLLSVDDKFCSQCGTPATLSKSDEPATSEASA